VTGTASSNLASSSINVFSCCISAVIAVYFRHERYGEVEGSTKGVV
jgi:uncharacterized membrane protein